jgi:hypothetical protein
MAALDFRGADMTAVTLKNSNLRAHSSRTPSSAVRT